MEAGKAKNITQTLKSLLKKVSKKLLSNFKRFYKIRLVNKIYFGFEFRPVYDVKRVD